MAFSDVRLAFVNYVIQVTGWSSSQVYWANQNIGRPAKPYATMLLTSFNNIGHDFVFPPDGITGSSKIAGNRDFTWNVQIYGDEDRTIDPIEILLEIYGRLSRTADYQIFMDEGVAFVDTLMGPTDISTVLDKSFEPRGAMDLLMRIPYESVDTEQGVIESTEVEATYKNVDDSVIMVQNIEIPEP